MFKYVLIVYNSDICDSKLTPVSKNEQSVLSDCNFLFVKVR